MHGNLIEPDNDFRRLIAIGLNRSNLAENGRIYLRVTGESMGPMILPGDMLQVSGVQTDKLRRGDILVVLRGKELVTHRVIQLCMSGYILKGDRLSYVDPLVQKEVIIGLVTAIERNRAVGEMGKSSWKILNLIIGWLGWIHYRLGRLSWLPTQCLTRMLILLANKTMWRLSD